MERIENIRIEVMQTLAKNIHEFVDKFLVNIDTIWQPSDFLPDPQGDNFLEEIKELQELGKEFDDDLDKSWLKIKETINNLTEDEAYHLNMLKYNL